MRPGLHQQGAESASFKTRLLPGRISAAFSQGSAMVTTTFIHQVRQHQLQSTTPGPRLAALARRGLALGWLCRICRVEVTSAWYIESPVRTRRPTPREYSERTSRLRSSPARAPLATRTDSSPWLGCRSCPVNHSRNCEMIGPSSLGEDFSAIDSSLAALACVNQSSRDSSRERITVRFGGGAPEQDWPKLKVFGQNASPV